MDNSHDIEEDNVAALYEASHKGCESTLNSLMERDALILNKISLTSFTDTPLHIAVLHGHLEFTAALLRKKPNLSGRKDLRGQTALHLASAEGHAEIVRELLQADTDACLARDQDGRIPLHLAVMRGHTELLVESADNDGYSLNSKDNDGNSMLHLAVMLGQTETIKYLLSVAKIKGEANAINRIGNTALDVLQLGHRDFKSLNIQDMLMGAGVRRSKDLNSPDLLTTTRRHERTAARSINNEAHEPSPAAQSRFKKWWAYFCLCGWVKHFKRRGRSNWVVETRGTLMLVATVIATVTFQGGINPPGGVWQQDCQDTKYGNVYGQALSVVLLITLGIPKRGQLFLWLLTLSMLIAVTLSSCYTPIFWLCICRIYFLSLGVLLVVLLIAGVVLIYRLLAWMVKFLPKCIRCLAMSPTN
ncbi:hypothetical protein I3843_03G105900 [Carya illinoinensis]|nr:hypothetical protein I3843_03G105900 [Carya illinoinensis]